MVQVTAVMNHKGGVGKTTTAVNLAACWAEQGKKVLLVDHDPQGSASFALNVPVDGHGLLQALKKSTALPVAATRMPGLSLVPSGPGLGEARQRFSGGIGLELLRRCLDRTPGPWDRIVIDCPPGEDILTLGALRASGQVLVPVEVHFLGLNGLQQIAAIIGSVRRHNPGLAIHSIIPCRAHPRRRIHHEIMDRLEALFPGRVSPVVRENVSLAEAPARGLPVILSAPRSHGAFDYRAVAEWLEERL
ncbi:MAG TPA: ParA family protein [Syntrophales bacterium]|nr:ParA family protein [Syntrophales bacterium]